VPTFEHVKIARRHRSDVVTRGKAGPNIQNTVGLIGTVAREIRLILRLLANRQVPIYTKLIPVFTVLYIVSPLDLTPDPILGLGQLDDAAILLLGLNLFVELCPRDVVAQLRREMSEPPVRDDDADVVDTTYRVLDD
jgi:uncharacterized membrane protein YkvA (DUF1232 family)